MNPDRPKLYTDPRSTGFLNYNVLKKDWPNNYG